MSCLAPALRERDRAERKSNLRSIKTHHYTATVLIVALDLLVVPGVRAAFGDSVAPSRACVAVHQQQAAPFEPLIEVVAGGVAAEIHVDRRPEAHCRHDGAELSSPRLG